MKVYVRICTIEVVSCAQLVRAACFLQGGMCSVYCPEEDKVVNISAEHLQATTPEKQDRVSCLSPSVTLQGDLTPLTTSQHR